MTSNPVPVALFAYARIDHLQRVLTCLRENRVPLIYAFSDAPRTPEKAESVAEVRRMLHAIDWCEIHITERDQNLGLGRSIRAGVTQVLQQHEAVLVVEDDLVFVPGMYAYLSAALNYYADDDRVMTVAGWNNPHIIPTDITDQPYFDGRSETWVWGTWRRHWLSMTEDAATYARQCRIAGIDVYRYGADIYDLVDHEFEWNIWSVRWFYWVILNGGLCLRPPYSMVDHKGWDELATNAFDDHGWRSNPPLKPCPPIPQVWPEPIEHPECSALWQAVEGGKPDYIKRTMKRVKKITPEPIKKMIRPLYKMLKG